MSSELWFLFLAGAGALIILLPLWKILFLPARLIFKIGLNGIIGFMLLWLANTFGSLMGLYLPINWATLLVAGFLGIPGIIFMGFIKIMGLQ